MMAELIHHYLPSRIELHNYPPASAAKQKLDNWRTLNRKPMLMYLRLLSLSLSHSDLTTSIISICVIVQKFAQRF